MADRLKQYFINFRSKCDFSNFLHVAATVESITHVNALKYFTAGKLKIPGVQPKFAGVIEQRLTGFLIFSLVGCSVKMASYLKYIPMPVLYGVFVYMGIFALMGQQLVERIISWPIKKITTCNLEKKIFSKSVLFYLCSQ